MFTVTPESMEVTEGDELDLMCKAIGRPTPKISWFLEKDQLPEQDEHIMLSQAAQGDEQSSILALKNLLPTKHAGKYTIEASNSVGTATQTVELTG